MITIPIPYDRGSLPLVVPKDNFKALIAPRNGNGNFLRSQEEILLEALRQPLGTPALRELARGRDRVTLVTSDHTRSMPSRITLPLLLSEIRSGNPQAVITILIATGLHRPTTEGEQRRMFGDKIVDEETILVNDAFDPTAFSSLGTLPSGASCSVHRAVLDTDLLVAEGFIEPHFLAGFSGGRKSILPGVCDAATVNENHSFQAISRSGVEAGQLAGNPIHLDMVEAARRVGVDFILNVTLDHTRRISGAFVGDLEQAHAAGVDVLKQELLCQRVEGDIVVTSNGGYPLDQNLYQTPKAATTAEKCAGKDGVIILFSACTDGLGGETFARLMQEGSPEEIEAKLARIAPRETLPESWCVLAFARILQKHPVILVSQLDPQTVRRMNLLPARDGQEALEQAFKLKGQGASLVAIPDGVNALIV